MCIINLTKSVISSHVDNMSDYHVIFLGYPNWWGKMPMAVFNNRTD